jgi:hypothetical protein
LVGWGHICAFWKNPKILYHFHIVHFPDSAAVLAQPDIEKSFDVYCDASDMGIGGVLMQDGHAVAYAS